jgi:hypothetical protein
VKMTWSNPLKMFKTINATSWSLSPKLKNLKT